MELNMNYFVFARQNPEEPFQPVSYKNKTDTKNPLDIRNFLHNMQDFALNETHALEAKEHLEKRGYEVISVIYSPRLSVIDLDGIIAEEENLQKFNDILRAHKVISTEKS